MEIIKRFLFPDSADDRSFSAFLLSLRVLFGLLLMTHGFQKLCGWAALSTSFPDPLGLGSEMSLCLAVFAEVGCSVAFIFGFLTRLSMIPMIVTMVVAFVFVHGVSISEGELAFVYLVVFVLVYIFGPGHFSIDWLIKRRICGQAQ